MKGVFNAFLHLSVFVSVEDEKFPLGSTESWHPSGAPYLPVYLTDCVLDDSRLQRAEDNFECPCHTCGMDQKVYVIQTSLTFLTLLLRLNWD